MNKRFQTLLASAFALLAISFAYFQPFASAVTATSQPFQACGRLTLTTATPVMTATVSSATTIFYTPYGCDRISLYNGSDLVLYEFSEMSNSTAASSTGSAGPAVVAATSNYDLFVWNKAGTLTLTRGPAWTSATARNLTLTLVHGVNVNTSAITNGPAAQRGLYVGTVHSAGDSTVNWQFGAPTTISNWGTAAHDVWNMYNRRPVMGVVGAPNTAWTYNSTTIRAAGGQTATARVTFVTGLNEDPVYATWGTRAQTGGTISAGEQGVSLDSTTTIGGPINQGNFTASSFYNSWGSYAGLPGLGTHFLSAVEVCSAAQTVTFASGNTGTPVFVIGMPYQLFM